MFPKITQQYLREILDEEVTLPEFLTEEVYLNDFKHNRQLCWKPNLYLHKYDLIRVFMAAEDYACWKRLKLLNMLLLLLFTISIMWFEIYPLLILVPVYLVIINITVHHSVFIIGCITALAFNEVLNFDAAYFWQPFFSISAGYMLNKYIADRVDATIKTQAFQNANSFWRYYSNGLIYLDRHAKGNGYSELMIKYPELKLQ